MKIIVKISTDKVKSECESSFEIDKDDWDEMTEDERNEMIWEEAIQQINYDYEVIEDE